MYRYNEELEGIPISYHNHTIESKSAMVNSYFPLCCVRVHASLTVIRPCPGQFVMGRVTEVSDTFIGLLVLNFINCVIKMDQIRSEFSYHVFGQRWKSKKDAGHEIGVGDMVRFQVEDVQRHGGFATVIGSLKTPFTGNMTYLQTGAMVSGNNVEEKRAKETKSKKRKKKTKDTDTQQTANETYQAPPLTGAHDEKDAKKRKKKDKKEKKEGKKHKDDGEASKKKKRRGEGREGDEAKTKKHKKEG